jgi:predicted alpha/beta superfamily hydrolase
MPNPSAAGFSANRRASIVALLGFATAGCGGGGTGTVMAGSLQSASIASRSNGTTYSLNIYLPPNSAATRATLPVVYLLDGDSRFPAMVEIVEATRAQVAIVGIGNEALRARDYVPQNLCTPGGGGEGAFLDFIRLELIPFVETNVAGDPLRRILLGHSHGGSFVLYALFAETAPGRHFSAYLASDASIDCMNATVYGWEAAYAAANTALALRLHISYGANLANADFATKVQSRQYSGLSMAAQFYSGGHIGMIPMAFADALAFALA